MKSRMCELCNLGISGEKCVFVVYKRTIYGVEHHFCCEHHADESEWRPERKVTLSPAMLNPVSL